MDSGVCIDSVFDVINDIDLVNYVRDLDERKSKLISMFSEMPQRATGFSAGYDLSILNDEVIPAHESRIISFGNSVHIDNFTVTGVVVPRSSLAKKKGLILSGGPTYIYSGMRRTCIAIKFINFTDEEVRLTAGEKIAQVVFIRYPSWLTGISDDIKDINISDIESSVLPDPLDEIFMSPLLDGNLEPVNDLKTIDQTDKVSYRFQSPKDVILEPGKVTCVMTGIKCKMDSNQVFILKNAFNNSCVELANSIGVIDADYYGNPDNDGEIGVLLLNRGCIPVKVNAGDVIASGAVYYYAKADGDQYGGKRTGGFGSTDSK